MTAEEKDALDKAVRAFKALPQSVLIMKTLSARLEAARKIHETVSDVQIPCQHRWSQGKVVGMTEFYNFLDGDLR